MRTAPLLIVALAAAGVLLSGCAGSAEDDHTGAYLSGLKAVNIKYSSDSEAIAEGRKACDSLASGTSYMTVVDNVSGAGDKSNAAVVVGTAIGALCPDQKSKVTAG
ncbi:MAG: DUF732 domain-containing protein [Mycolicibacterium sp.]|jgi:outer membrane murein-binding lipoprotein Lpp|nr:DUF732 domain-containing protein [Mycolicibacterium sp.]